MTTQHDAARLAAIISAVDGVVWECEADTLVFTYVGGRVEHILGFTPEDWLASPTFWQDHLHPEDRDETLETCRRFIVRHEDHELEYRMIAADGRAVWLRDFVTVVVEDGVATKLCGVMVDVTQERAVRDRLRESQKMEAVGRLAGGVAHEFNNALVAILLESELGEAVPGLPAAAARSFRTIRAAAAHAGELTQQLLVFGRQQVLRPRDLDLDALVESKTRMLRSVVGADVTLDLDLAAHGLDVHADPALLEQLVLRLALHGRDAMPRGGTLRIETRDHHLDAAALSERRGREPGPWVELTVRDTGDGIRREDMPHLFEPFFSHDHDAPPHGLGLAIVFGIVDGHGGFIDVETERGVGTAFRVFLPGVGAAQRVPASHPAGPAESRPPPSSRRTTVLLAEDDALVRRALKRVLANEGYRVLEAPDGPTAVAVFEAHEGGIDVLLTDIVMPGGMNGLELAEALLARDPSLGVVYTSGYSAEIAGREIDPDRLFLPKPFAPADVVAMIERSRSVSAGAA